MRLVNAYTDSRAADFLYELLAERTPETFISHREMPSEDEHRDFVRGQPFLYWLMIENDTGELVGAIECTDRNEIGVSILAEHQLQGLGKRALALFLDQHQPLPAVPAVRNGNWLANIAPRNLASLVFWQKQGFRVCQHTMVKI